MPEQRERMEYDVVIVGGGPAGLAAAIRLKQSAAAAGGAISVCLVEKGAEIGAHILSGAVIDPAPLEALLPGWQSQAPAMTAAREDRFYYLSAQRGWRIPPPLLPAMMRNRGGLIVSLSNLCRWLGRQAEALGVEIYPGFAAVDVLEGEGGAVAGIVTGDFGIAKDGRRKANYTPGMELGAKYTLLAEGARGSLSQRLIARFGLDAGRSWPKYGLGLKELWEVAADRHVPGRVMHTMGWPLDNRTGGGGFIYHWGERLVSLGLVVHLDYRNPHLDPFGELQRFKTHPLLRRLLEGGRCLGYGARVVSEGGFQSLPKLIFPGGALIGCGAGLLNLPRIKGVHNAIASAMLAADAVTAALAAGRGGDSLDDYASAYQTSPIAAELHRVRNVKPLWSRAGTIPGAGLGGLDLWCNAAGFSLFGSLRHRVPDHATLRPARNMTAINYPKPDGVLTFDRASALFLSGTNHQEDQPVHLRLTDPSLPLRINLPEYDEPAQRYCPAGVYTVAAEGLGLQIHAQNCLHCKACDIKDPLRNITWVAPEGGGGPQYSNM